MAASMDPELMQRIKESPLPPGLIEFVQPLAGSFDPGLIEFVQPLAGSFDAATPARQSMRASVMQKLPNLIKSSDKQGPSGVPSNKTWRSYIASFLVFLATHDVVEFVSSRDHESSLRNQLYRLNTRVVEGRFELEDFRNLLEAVTARPLKDDRVWQSVMSLAASLASQDQQPTLDSTHASQEQQPTWESTPRKPDSSTLRGVTERRELVERALREELKHSIFKNVPLFVQKIFPAERSEVSDVLDKVRQSIQGKSWRLYPASPDEDAVKDWLFNFLVPKYLQNTPHVYKSCKNHYQMKGSDVNRQMDIFVSRQGPNASASTAFEWKNVLVVGELTIFKNAATQKFDQMAVYVREVFKAQPTRFFVHAFLIVGLMMHPYIFDRSGVYGGTPFDVREPDEQVKFINILTSYCTRSEQELGIDKVIGHGKVHNTVKILSEPTSIRKTPLFFRRAILGRGSCCYPTCDGKAVVKFSWADDSKIVIDPESSDSGMSRESKLLQIANQRGVENIPTLVACKQFTSTRAWRDGLGLNEPASVQGGEIDDNAPNLALALSAQLQSASLSSPSDTRPVRETNEKDRKHDMRTRSQSRASSRTPLSDSRPTTGHSSMQSASRPPTSYSTRTNNSTLSHLQTADTFWLKRTLYAQMTEPAGRPLHKFTDLPQFLKAMRDAIKGHQSLYTTGKILHRDVSDGNIIITESLGKKNGCWGMLIDLELSAEVKDGNTVRTGLRRMTGTYVYMAIQILASALGKSGASIDHTYRHDLESFFYVLLNICLNVNDENKWEKENPLWEWFTGDLRQMERAKRYAIQTRWTEDVLDNFLPRYTKLKPLACELREILFTPASFSITTPRDPSVLYGPIIKAFETTIEMLEKPSGP